MGFPVSRRRYPGLTALGAALLLGACDPSGLCVLEPEVVGPAYLRDGVLYLDPSPEAQPYADRWLPEAQRRLLEASGLGVELSPGDGAPLVLGPPEPEPDEWYGSFRDGVLTLSIDSLDAYAENPSGVLLHEIMHGHGAKHVEQGAGLMSPRLSGAELLTSADLESLCTRAPCTTFQPESQ